VSVAARRFGKGGPPVSEIGLGCGGYWGLRSFPEARAAAIVDLALDRGVNLLDTGPNYSRGNAERRLGAILSGRRERVFLATKVGTRLDRGRTVKDWTPDGIRSSVERSLRALRTDRLDLVQLHSPGINEIRHDAVLRALSALKEEGLASFVGLAADGGVAGEAVRSGVFDAVMITHNVLHRRESGRVIDAAAAAGMAVLVKSPLAHALYGRSLLRPTSRARLWYLLRALRSFRADIGHSRALGGIEWSEGWTPERAALRFVLDNGAVTSAVVGTTDPAHLESDLSVSGGPRLPHALSVRLAAVDP
jgi:aryl-alcohol dehydrogenase-like predicted oxidoreductase